MSEAYGARLGSRGLVRVSGEEAVSFLQGIVTCDVEAVGPGAAAYGALLTPQGKFLFDFFVVADGDGFLLDCNGARAGALVQRLTFYRLRAKVTIEDCSGQYDVLGFWGGAPDLSDGLVYADPRLAVLGWRAIVATGSDTGAETDFAGTWSDEAAYHAHRLALGVSDGPLDLEPERSFPLEGNLQDLHGIDFQKGCYIGQEVTSRSHRRGKLRKRLMPVIISGALPAPGTPIMAGEKQAGEVRSGTQGRALALLRLDLMDQDLIAEDARLTPDVPDWMSFPEE